MKILNKIYNGISRLTGSESKAGRVLLSRAPDTVEIGGKISKLEKWNRLTGGINKEIVKRLDSIEKPEDFIIESYHAVKKGIGFSDEITPSLFWFSDKKSTAAYDNVQNLI